jgi:hypothetical protein
MAVFSTAVEMPACTVSTVRISACRGGALTGAGDGPPPLHPAPGPDWAKAAGVMVTTRADSRISRQGARDQRIVEDGGETRGARIVAHASTPGCIDR